MKKSSPVNGAGEDFANSFGRRLASERQRLGLSQQRLGERIGASKRSVIDWENGNASPKASFLSAMVEYGIDTFFLFHGRHLLAETEPLSVREKSLLDHYQNADEAGRRAIERVAMLEAQQKIEPKPHPPVSRKKAA